MLAAGAGTGSGPDVDARPVLVVDGEAGLSSHGVALLVVEGVGLVLHACWFLVTAHTLKQSCLASPEAEWVQELQLWVVG